MGDLVNFPYSHPVKCFLSCRPQHYHRKIICAPNRISLVSNKSHHHHHHHHHQGSTSLDVLQSWAVPGTLSGVIMHLHSASGNAGSRVVLYILYIVHLAMHVVSDWQPVIECLCIWALRWVVLCCMIPHCADREKNVWMCLISGSIVLCLIVRPGKKADRVASIYSKGCKMT